MSAGFERLFENSGEQEERQALNSLMTEWCDAVKECPVAEANGIQLCGDFFFVTDGFYPYYFKQKKKVLFITREPTEIKRRSEGIGRNDYLELFYNAYRKNRVSETPKGYSLDQFIGPAFHARMLYMAHAIVTDGAHTWEEDYPYSHVPWASKIGEKLGAKDGISFAYMNLSKYSNDNAGAYSAHDAKLIKKCLSDSAKGKFIKRELKLLNPDIIITANLWKDVTAKILDEALGKATFEEGKPPRQGTIAIDGRTVPVIDLNYFSAPHGDSATYKNAYFEPVSKFLFWKNLTAPTELAVDDIADTTVKLSWKEVKDADAYEVFWDTDPAFEPANSHNCKRVKAANCEIPDLDRGTIYHFKVRALNSKDDSRSWVAAIAAKTTGVAPVVEEPEPFIAAAPLPLVSEPAPVPEEAPKKKFSWLSLLGWIAAAVLLALLLLLLMRSCSANDELEWAKKDAASARAQLEASQTELGALKAENASLKTELEALRNAPPPAAIGLTFDDVHFIKNVSRFLSEGGDMSEGDYAERMDAIASDIKAALAESPERTVILIGFAARIGNESAELNLSRNRAARVQQELVKRGVPAGNLQIVRGGGTAEWGDNRNEQGRKANRVVRILLAK
jgi:outer membrane protein OmpA-like peptidoglycan-associated protein